MIAVFGENYGEYRDWLSKYSPYPIKLTEPGKPYFIWAGIGEDVNSLLSYERGMPFIVLPGFYFLSRKNHEYARDFIRYRLMIEIQLTDPKNAF